MESNEEQKFPQPKQLNAPFNGALPASPLKDPALAPLIASSPTLQAGLSQFKRDGIGVDWGSAGGGTYLDPGRKVVIDQNAAGKGERIARSLSHEIGHHGFAEPKDYSSKQAYVNNMLRGEAAATLSNALVRREILNHQGPDIGISGSGTRPQQYEAIADQQMAGRITRDAALNQIAQVFKTEQPSVAPSKTYEQYYGDYYDKNIVPWKLKQGRPEPGVVGDITTTDVKQGGLGPESPSASPKTALLPSQPGHADHALYQQIKSGVMQLDAQHGKEWDGASQRMTASLLALAKEEGLSRVDHVALNNPTPQLAGGEKVFVVQGALNDPAHQRAHMPTIEAVQTPETQSFDRLQALSQTQAQAREQQQALEQSQQAVSQAGPSMTR
ncbi:XVIPCD domain-containing protein [Xanthomonas campestris]|uniref:XVIPCD domain-containing protein n=1 Tax=Xanthomonas campestris TaxID=339 RepID=UPI00216135D2|nr:XVIPCD domain-containing protein [Xanthomonas campestris]MEA9577255.1 XVIPCD domain-containing protein [Xanthomonas campestris]